MKLMALITNEDGSAGVEIAVFFLLALSAGVGLICFSANHLQQAVAGTQPSKRY